MRASIDCQLLDLFQPKLKQSCVPHRHSMTVSLENSSFLHAFNKWSLLMHDLMLQGKHRESVTNEI